MTDRPIIFSGPMVRALLDGRKTQTRRAVKIKDHLEGYIFTGDLVDYYGNGRLGMVVEGSTLVQPIPYAVGDRLWVKETWRPSISSANPWHVAVAYPHDGKVKHWGWSSDADFGDWTIPKAAAKGNVTPLFMPRWASRLTLVVTDVRVQRLQEISETDAIAEGCRPFFDHANPKMMGRDRDIPMAPLRGPRDSFRDLWNSLHGADAWDQNPWVIALTFDVHKCNIDQMPEAA